MLVLKTSSELLNEIKKIKSNKHSIAFVPTMGNLHQGHLNLVSLAHQSATIIIVCIFVNPLQFNLAKDLENYPRTLKQDLKLCQEYQVDIVFSPSVTDIYPQEDQQYRIELPELASLSTILEGAHRPDHFSGVVTIVKKLFDLVRPDVAVFGEKDFQQLVIIRKMVELLKLPVKIISSETIREADGLAMSSRNTNLLEYQRLQASQLYDVLKHIREKIAAGNTNYETLIRAGLLNLVEFGFRPDYLEIVDCDTLQPSDAKQTRDRIIVTAVWLGSIRLIDNLRL